MANYEDYIHQLHNLVHVLDKLITNKPNEIKKILKEIDLTEIQKQHDKKSHINQNQAKTKEKSNASSKENKTSRIPIEQAKIFLNENFPDIHSVEEWSETMGYSKSYFWRKFEAFFRLPPQTVFIEKKKAALIEFLKKNKDCNSGEAARIIHLRDGNGLYQFVKHHFHCTPTQLKEKIRNN